MPDRRIQALIYAALLILGILYGCKKAGVLRFTETRPVASATCGECHEDIYAEWKNSPHAEAWTSKDYMKSLDETGTVACWPCHAPAVLEEPESKPPIVRESNLIEGVNCAACHGGQCPYIKIGAADGVSVIASPPTSADAEAQVLCGACHEHTYSDWLSYSKDPATGLKEQVPTCVKCHMRKEHEWLRSSSGFRPVRSDALQTSDRPEDHNLSMPWRRSIVIETVDLIAAEKQGFHADLLLHNRLAGHGLPSGYYGYREIRLEAWLDEYAPEKVTNLRFFVEMGTTLKPGPNGPFRMTFAETGSILNLRVIRVTDPSGEPLVIDELLVDLPGSLAYSGNYNRKREQE